MSVTFIDPPGPLANTSEPIDFTTSYPVTSISIEYDPRVGRGARETVYDGVADDNTGGDFAYVYRRSTRSVDGLTWRIQREGKWPSELRIRVKEATPTSTSGLGYGTTYEVDLTAQDPLTMNAAGSYTIDGMTWWAKGPFLNPGTTAAVEAGLGLGMKVPGALSFGLSWRGSGNVLYPERVFVLPLAQLPGYNPLAPVAVMASLAGRYSYGGEGIVFAGLVDAALSSAALTGPEKATAMTTGLSSSTGGIFLGSPHNTDASSEYSVAANPNLPNAGDLLGSVAGVHRFGDKRYFPLMGAEVLSNESPDSYNKFPVNGFTYVRNGNGISSNPCFLFVVNRGSAEAQPTANYLRRLKIMQPRNP